MKVNFNSALMSCPAAKTNTKSSAANQQPSFKAVNKKLYEKAEDWYRRRGNLETCWYDDIRMAAILFKTVSKRDALDTMHAVRKFVEPNSMKFFNHVLDNLRHIKE